MQKVVVLDMMVFELERIAQNLDRHIQFLFSFSLLKLSHQVLLVYQCQLLYVSVLNAKRILFSCAKTESKPLAEYRLQIHSSNYYCPLKVSVPK